MLEVGLWEEVEADAEGGRGGREVRRDQTYRPTEILVNHVLFGTGSMGRHCLCLFHPPVSGEILPNPHRNPSPVSERHPTSPIPQTVTNPPAIRIPALLR